MVREAHSAYCRRSLKDSVFRIAWTRNRILEATGRPEGKDDMTWRPKLTETIEQEREVERQKHRSHHTVSQALTDVHTAPEVLRHIDENFSRRNSMTITLWLLRRPFGKPEKCMRCKRETATIKHVQECTGLPIDHTLKEGDFQTALKYIWCAMHECYGKTEPRDTNYEEELRKLVLKHRGLD